VIPAQRYALILDAVRRTGAASVQTLASEIDASTATVRRDLDYLTRCGYLERTHGGAMLRARLRTTFEPAADISSSVARADKVAIGAKAAELVEEGQSVIFDSSSTVLEAARAVIRRGIALTAVTNDLRIASLFADREEVKLIVTGGTLRRGSYTLVGEPGHGFVEGLTADIAFIGTHALTDLWLSDTSLEVAEIKKRMAAAARRTVVLADSSKFEQAAFRRVCHLGSTAMLICDDCLLPVYRAAVLEAGVSLSLAETGNRP
jgi:DeoR family transcriptional regulator of aga operon